MYIYVHWSFCSKAPHPPTRVPSGKPAHNSPGSPGRHTTNQHVGTLPGHEGNYPSQGTSSRGKTTSPRTHVRAVRTKPHQGAGATDTSDAGTQLRLPHLVTCLRSREGKASNAAPSPPPGTCVRYSGGETAQHIRRTHAPGTTNRTKARYSATTVMCSHTQPPHRAQMKSSVNNTRSHKKGFRLQRTWERG